MNTVLSAIITEEDGGFVASNPDTGVVSQGDSLNEALANLTEALQLYIEEVGNSSLKNINSHSFLTTVTV